ncbi:MAG TPA: hypothetical protein VGF54_11650 [Streptosporangiaceae bacterium]|jgi:hypothetical protein
MVAPAQVINLAQGLASLSASGLHLYGANQLARQTVYAHVPPGSQREAADGSRH